jgi:hypothetical protein
MPESNNEYRTDADLIESIRSKGPKREAAWKYICEKWFAKPEPDSRLAAAQTQAFLKLSKQLKEKKIDEIYLKENKSLKVHIQNFSNNFILLEKLRSEDKNENNDAWKEVQSWFKGEDEKEALNQCYQNLTNVFNKPDFEPDDLKSYITRAVNNAKRQRSWRWDEFDDTILVERPPSASEQVEKEVQMRALVRKVLMADPICKVISEMQSNGFASAKEGDLEVAAAQKLKWEKEGKPDVERVKKGIEMCRTCKSILVWRSNKYTFKEIAEELNWRTEDGEPDEDKARKKDQTCRQRTIRHVRENPLLDRDYKEIFKDE